MTTGLPHQCHLCKSARVKFLFIKQSIPYYKCSACGFIFSQPKINANLTNEITDFEPAYLEYLQEKKTDKKNHSSLVNLLKNHVDLSRGRILDIGCGSGKLVRHLRKEGYEAYGLEVATALYDEFLKNDSIYFHGPVSTFARQCPNDKYSLIILSDVIEHIEQPEPFIADISKLLSDQGVLFITTPNTRSLLARVLGKNWHYYNKYHLSLFSISNLTLLLNKYDFSKLASGHVTRHQSLYYLVKYALNFGLQRNLPVPSFLSRIHFPVNLFDNMYGIYKKAYYDKVNS